MLLNIDETYSKLDKLRKMKKSEYKNKAEILRFLKLCYEQLSDNPKAQSQIITILVKLNRFDEALKICEEHLNNEQMQSQRVTILIKLGRLKEALKICEEHLTYEPIQSQKQKILNELYGKDNEKNVLDYIDLTSVFKNDNDLKSSILTKIYLDCITEEEIINSKLDEYDKMVLLIAYYERKNKKKGIHFMKELKKNNLNKEINQYNNLLQRLITKKDAIFDTAFYIDILQCTINYDIIKTFEQKNETEEKQEEKEEIKEKKQEENIKKKSKQSEQKKYIILSGNTVNNRNAIKEYNSTKEKNFKENKNTLLIKDIFYNEIIEIGKQLYLKLNNYEIRKDAIRAWDILENISYSPVSDKKSLEKMITIINKLYPENRKSNEKKYIKYL